MTAKERQLSRTDLAIIGGGISGLSTAWYAQKHGLSYTLLEESGRWGGKILTEQVDDGFIVEGGPDSFITQKPWGLQLARELGLSDRVLGTNDQARKTYVLNRGKPVPLPEGVMLIVPTKIMPFVRSPLISPLGKLRMGMDLFIPPKRDGQDETLADFISRRLGREALDKIAEPLLSGIYNADAERQSMLATFPRFRQMEEKYGSLTQGMLASIQARRQAPKLASNGRPPSAFVSFTSGVSELVQTLNAQLTGDLRLNVGVVSLAMNAVSDSPTYRLALSDGSQLQASAVVLAIPAYTSSRLINDIVPNAAQDLAAIRYVSTGTISFAFRERDLPGQLPGFGVVVPRSEKRPINAITISSTKFDHRAPNGNVLLRCFFGGSRSPHSMELGDTELIGAVGQELKKILGINAEPLFHRIFRWHNSNPQYDVGHLDRVAAIEQALPPGLFVTGSPYRGVGIPDCVHQGQQTAAKIAAMARPMNQNSIHEGGSR